LKHFHGEWIQVSRFKSGALGFEELAALLIEQRRRHLAARAIVHTDEQNFLFHRDENPLFSAKMKARRNVVATGFRLT
jgi:hypothetical protein